MPIVDPTRDSPNVIYEWLGIFPRPALDVCGRLYHKRRRRDEPLERKEELRCRQVREQWKSINATYRPPPTLNPTAILPRGVQILAEDPYDLKLGFPYHSFLEKCDISIDGWNHVVRSILGKFEHCGGARFHFPDANNFEINTLAQNMEYILDNVAEQDISFFRPRGFIMRMDMPGEQEFGLDFMDLYVGRNGGSRADALPHNLMEEIKFAPLDHECIKTSKFDFCAICLASKGPQKKRNLHRDNIRREFFNGTRIVIDPLAVLEDPVTAYKRGWTNWSKQCSDAAAKKPVSTKNDQDKPLPLPRDGKGMPRPVFKDGDDQYTFFKSLDRYLEAKRKSPLSERVFRWPPSKQIFYDRWRGHTTDSVGHSHLFDQWHHSGTRGQKNMWVPWADSMDKRMHAQRQPQIVVPADGIEIIELSRGKSGKTQARKDRDSVVSARALPKLESEIKVEYLRLHDIECEQNYMLSLRSQDSTYNASQCSTWHRSRPNWSGL